MTNSTVLQKQGYKGVKVTSMIQALRHSETYKHLRLVQQDEFRRIENRYNKNGYLTKPYFTYLWNLYWNFVLNDFRFNDKSKVWSVPSKMKEIKPQHIGMKIFKKLEDEK